MSLPSVAIYYDKNGKEIHRDGVNIGWFIEEEAWVRCVHDQVLKVQDCLIVELYGIKFPLKWKHIKYERLLRLLFNERLAIEKQKQNLNGYQDYLKIKQSYQLKQRHTDQSKVLMSMIRRVVPSLIAEDIVGVQPMSEPSNLVWSLRKRYFREAWYIRLWNYIKNILLRGDDPKVWYILREISREQSPTFLNETWTEVRNTLKDELEK